MVNLPKYIDPRSRVAMLWEKPLSEVASVPSDTSAAEDSERHSIYSLLLMAMIKEWWMPKVELLTSTLTTTRFSIAAFSMPKRVWCVAYLD